jgi:hypothetical protein
VPFLCKVVGQYLEKLNVTQKVTQECHCSVFTLKKPLNISSKKHWAGVKSSVPSTEERKKEKKRKKKKRKTYTSIFVAAFFFCNSKNSLTVSQLMNK